MKFFITQLLLFLTCNLIFAQSNQLKQSDFSSLEYFDILPDNNYAFEQILEGNLPFVSKQKFKKTTSTEYYWLRFEAENKMSSAQNFYLRVHPNIENKIYFFDKNLKKWKSESFGLSSKKQVRTLIYEPVVFELNQKSTFYIKTKIVHNNSLFDTKYFAISLEDAKLFENNEELYFNFFMLSLFIMLSFFCYNLYLFYFFKDNTYANYLTIVVGGLIYIAAYNRYFYVLSSLRLFQINMEKNLLYYIDLNDIILKIGIILVMQGFVQFTRNFLQLSVNFPYWDKLLYKMIVFFVGFIVFESSLNVFGIWDFSLLLNMISNIYVLFIILIIFYIGILSYRKGNKLAKYFLLANTFPLLIIIILALYLIIYTTTGKGSRFLPNIAVVSYAITSAIALMARVNLMREDLNQKLLEVQILQNDYAKIEMRNQAIVTENQYISNEIAQERDQNEVLQLKLDSNERELASNTLFNIQKNDLLKVLQKQVGQLSTQTNSQQKTLISELNSTIKNNMIIEADWDKFKLHFEQMHPNFFKELNEKYPSLTAYEIRLSVYLHLKLSTKEIAMLLNIDPASVRKAKMRLNKKIPDVEL